MHGRQRLLPRAEEGKQAGATFWWLSSVVAMTRGFPKLWVPLGGTHNQDYSLLGSILGSPYSGILLILRKVS